MILYALIIFILLVYFAAVTYCVIRRAVMLRKINKAWSELQALILKKAALVTPLRKICSEHKLINGDLAKTLIPAYKTFTSSKTRRELLHANKKLSFNMGRVILTLSQNKQTAANELFSSILEQNATFEQSINFLEIFFTESVDKFHTFTASAAYIFTAGFVTKKRSPMDFKLM